MYSYSKKLYRLIVLTGDLSKRNYTAVKSEAPSHIIWTGGNCLSIPPCFLGVADLFSIISASALGISEPPLCMYVCVEGLQGHTPYRSTLYTLGSRGF